MIRVPFSGYDFDDQICLMLSMITIMNCEESCFFYISSSDDDCTSFTHKEISMVNLINSNVSHIIQCQLKYQQNVMANQYQLLIVFYSQDQKN